MREWKEWFSNMGGRFLLFARQQCRSDQEAEDVLQMALVRCWKATEGRIPDTAFVFHKIRQTAIDSARSSTRREKREQTVWRDGETVSWFDRTVERDERYRELESAIKLLPPPQQEVITLKIWGELTFDEIGKTLGISINTAASRYRYAIESLRANMAAAKS